MVETRETTDVAVGIIQIGLCLVYFDGHFLNGRTMP